jgi:HlyD family secretion protein
MGRKNGSNVASKHSINHHLVPIVVWAVTVVGVAGLFYHRSRQVVVFGLVQGRSLDVAATCRGRVMDVKVKLFDPVKQGQTVAILDILPDDQRSEEQVLKSELETISAQIQHLTAQLAPTQEQITAEARRNDSNWAENLRRFATDVDNVRLRVLELRAQIETDRMVAKTLETDIAISRKLVDVNAVDAGELAKLQAEDDRVQTSIKENGLLLDQTQKNLDLAQQRHADFAKTLLEHPSVDHALEVIRMEMAVQERMMDQVSTRLTALRSKQSFELKAPFDGVISAVTLEAGDVADVNACVARISQADPTEVLGYLDESQAGSLRGGASVEVMRAGSPPMIARGEVVSVGPVVEQLPAQLWRSRNAPQWGRPFLVRTSGEMKLLAGEKVGIRQL